LPLYSFIEGVDGLIDYEKIVNEYPGLSYSQISGVFTFLKRVAQFNIKAIDIEQLIDDEMADSETFLSELRAAMKQETTRVLNFD
jgi:hypothetical protein